MNFVEGFNDSKFSAGNQSVTSALLISINTMNVKI